MVPDFRVLEGVATSDSNLFLGTEGSESVRALGEEMACTQNGTLVNGNLDYNLRSPAGLILTHTHMAMGQNSNRTPQRTSQSNH